ncbi:MAG: hypothetical protein DRI90_12745 [Deltaproteobacteria bacterium]|nr:MAG: hypothetical protein DRI90_12745 [Deltaproteobacteria bacterium]
MQCAQAEDSTRMISKPELLVELDVEVDVEVDVEDEEDVVAPPAPPLPCGPSMTAMPPQPSSATQAKIVKRWNNRRLWGLSVVAVATCRSVVMTGPIV